MAMVVELDIDPGNGYDYEYARPKNQPIRLIFHFSFIFRLTHITRLRLEFGALTLHTARN